MRLFRSAFGLTLFVFIFFFFLSLSAISPARADWPSAEDVVKTVAPIAGLNGDQVEFALFAMKEPTCASTIVSYTAAQDYSLVGFIGGLKATKLQSIPSMPKMSEGQCIGYNPVQQAYIFVDGMGNKLLGVNQANYLRGLLQQQIAEGKSELEAQVAAIPYLGTILANWDCACMAAFKTNLASEKVINDAVAFVISVGKAVKSGDISGALEMMIIKFGPKVACDLGAKWTGVGSIPVVSDIAAEACNGVAGKAVDWVVSGASVTAEALGIVGGEHIPPEQYYKSIFTPEIAKDGYMELADILYGKCYSYFEQSNMASSTAKKVCTGMRARYVEESIGKIQWNDFQAERSDYYSKNVEPKAVAAAFLTDAQFSDVKSGVVISCKAYFSQKYPKATSYAKAYGGEPIENICDSFVTYSKSSYKAWDMDKVRAQTQSAAVYAVTAKHAPFCKNGDARNVVVCNDQAIKACFADLSDTCSKTTSPLGGMERPCCQLGTADSSSFNSAKAHADKTAMAQTPYCKTEDKDPLRVSCSLPQAYNACLKTKLTWGSIPTCAKADKYPNGTASEVCCEMDESWLASVPGLKEAMSYTETVNAVKNGVCGIGGMHKGLSYDPRIIHCANGAPLSACEAKFGNSCKILGSGYVDKICCDIAVFSGAAEEQKPYNPEDRSNNDLALTAKVVAQSGGQCYFGKTDQQKEDKFKVICDTLSSADMCLKVIGRPAKTPCTAKMKDGWVTSPCCERSAKALQADVRTTIGSGIKTPTAKDVKMLGAPLSKEGEKRKMGTVDRKVAPASGINAPKAGDKRALGTLGKEASQAGSNAGTRGGASGPANTGTARTVPETPPVRSVVVPVEENYKP